MSSSFLVDKLQSLVSDWRNNNYANTLPETRNILEHITRIGFLHRPQLEALETYIYLKEVVGNRPTVEIIKGLFTDEKELLQGIGVSKEEAFDLLGNKEAIEALLTEKFGESLDYANQVYALTMGSGKTILMAAFMIYDFVLSYYHPKDRRFGKNALVFAPDKTIIESLKEIKSFDYSKIVPKEYLNVLLGLKYHYLEDTKSALAPIGNYNVIVTNSQKIILKTKKEATRSLLSDLQELEKREVENKRLAAIRNLESLLIFVDEAHHSYGKSLEGSLKKTRQTINYIHGNKPLVGVLNLTGTPYVNNRMIPDVVFHFGLKQGIEQGILKQVRFYEYSNVKSEEFIEDVVEKFWSEYGENKLEDKLPKIAFYAANIEEIQSDLRPKLEKILANRSISLGKVLEYHTEAEESRDEFNDLDKPESKKQFILLVGKGTEGWNCRSLTSTALYRKPRSSIFVLQSSTRCLRSIGDNSTKASVFVSNENYKILDKELKKNFQTSI
ncbi:DEAD/DEAH box helicase family protein, partial [Candidatus Berkelbacteria bacterium]|nr:DEAD/DEAH box helicase family protein [Candidatus Berkelbacteria bacterium]